MDKPTIGIRQADGSFYEIMGDAEAGHKRLVLSAARTDQHGVRIDLYRSTDNTIQPEGALGSIVLEDSDGLGYEDISFRVDLDAEGQLNAAATLPGQPPQSLSVDLTRFRNASPDALPSFDLPDFEDTPPRSDADILNDESLDSAELDTLDMDFDEPLAAASAPEDDFSPELDPEVSLDLPDAEDEPPRRSDADILSDESLASAELDTLDDFTFEEDPEGGTPETRGLDEMALPETETDDFALPDMDAEDLGPPPALDDLDPPAAEASFDLGDLDAGFGEDEPAPPAADASDDWEKIDLDDMEPMEFLDTGAEISAPKTPATDSFAADEAADTLDDFSMGEEPLELADFDSDLSDLPDLDDGPRSAPPSSGGSEFDNDLDQDFLAPPALTEPAPWESETDSEPEPLPASGRSKPAKKAKASKKEASAPGPRAAASGGLDKAALLLSLSALSLLVLLILVLLFLNMIKAPQAPVIQPEVERWKESSMAQDRPAAPETAALDLRTEPGLEASGLLEVPAALRTARVSLVLEPGETLEDVASRLGDPARVQGDQLLW